MKRAITFILILLLFCSSSLASSIDNPFDTMSDEEILLCYQLTMDQMQRRNLSPYSTSAGVTVPAGKYTVGIDIPAGIYRLEFPNDEYDVGTIFIYVSGKEYPDNYYSVGKGAQVPVYGKLELVDGMVFDLQDTTATFYTYTGLFGDLNN